MATAEVQHPVPAAVHDGNCFQEEESHKVTVQADVPATEVEEAPGSEEQVHAANGVSTEDTKDKEDDSKENPKNHEVEADVATDAGDDRLMQDVAQEVEAKLCIVQDNITAAADDEAKPPKEEAQQGREVTRKAAGKAVVVPVDDDDDLIDGEAAAPPEEEGATKEEAKGEVLKEEKAQEE